MRSGLGSVITIAMVALSMHPAYGRAKSPVFIARGAPVEPPRGFLAMCEQDQTFCGSGNVAGAGDDSSIDLPIEAASFAQPGQGSGTADLPVTQPSHLLNFGDQTGSYVSSQSAGFSVFQSLSPILSTSDPLGALLTIMRAVPAPAAAVSPNAMTVGTGHGKLVGTSLAEMPTAGLSTKAFHVAQPTTVPAETGPKGDSRQKAALLKEVNNLVNSRVRQRPDIDVYAEAEHWSRSGIGAQAVGDCEDLAIEKRYQLLARGFDPAEVSFAVVFSAATGLHTVLVARTEEGDMVLDSATPWVRRADQTGYSWISIQSTDDQMRWVSARV